MPMEKLATGAWPHPARLPLGCGWSGRCTAPGHEGETPDDRDLEFCNLGYASGCARLPKQRVWDAVRFAMVAPHESAATETTSVGMNSHSGRTRAGSGLRRNFQVQYVCERAHLPVEHGRLEFEAAESKCLRPHPDARVQKMAECFLATYLIRANLREAAAS